MWWLSFSSRSSSAPVNPAMRGDAMSNSDGSLGSSAVERWCFVTAWTWCILRRTTTLYQKHSPCQTDGQWEELLDRILRNHLELWRGTAVIRGTVHPEGNMLVQHDMHLSQAFQPILLSSSCQRSTLSKSCSRDSTVFQYYHHSSVRVCAHRRFFSRSALSLLVHT